VNGQVERRGWRTTCTDHRYTQGNTKSKAQRCKFAELLVKGKISPETFEEWNQETGDAKLPMTAQRIGVAVTKS
jgi:hypothetical protein